MTCDVFHCETEDEREHRRRKRKRLMTLQDAGLSFPAAKHLHWQTHRQQRNVLPGDLDVTGGLQKLCGVNTGVSWSRATAERVTEETAQERDARLSVTYFPGMKTSFYTEACITNKQLSLMTSMTVTLVESAEFNIVELSRDWLESYIIHSSHTWSSDAQSLCPEKLWLTRQHFSSAGLYTAGLLCHRHNLLHETRSFHWSIS